MRAYSQLPVSGADLGGGRGGRGPPFRQGTMPPHPPSRARASPSDDCYAVNRPPLFQNPGSAPEYGCAMFMIGLCLHVVLLHRLCYNLVLGVGRQLRGCSNYVRLIVFSPESSTNVEGNFTKLPPNIPDQGGGGR